MKTITLNIVISEAGELEFSPQVDLPPGEYEAVLVIEEKLPAQSAMRPPLNFPVIDIGEWPEDLSLRREDLYD